MKVRSPSPLSGVMSINTLGGFTLISHEPQQVFVNWGYYFLLPIVDLIWWAAPTSRGDELPASFEGTAVQLAESIVPQVFIDRYMN